MEGMGLRAVLAALAAGYRRAESDRADGAGSETARSRWLPRLSAALERGVWWRVQYTLRALEWRAAPEVDDWTCTWCCPTSRAILLCASSQRLLRRWGGRLSGFWDFVSLFVGWVSLSEKPNFFSL